MAGKLIESYDCPLAANTDTLIMTVPKDVIGLLNYLDFGYSCTFLIVSSSSTGIVMTKLGGNTSVEFSIVNGYDIYAKCLTARNSSKYNFVKIATRQ